jgi:RNA polymerase sigma factor (sigma-70 family)
MAPRRRLSRRCSSPEPGDAIAAHRWQPQPGLLVNEQVLDLIAARRIYDAWSLLRSELGDAVHRYVHQRARGADTDAVIQGIWNDVYRALPDYRPGRTVLSWLLALARARLALGAPSTGSLSVAHALYAARTSERVALNRRDLPALEQAIAARPEDERELLELRYVNHLRADEIAAILGTSARRVERDLMAIVENLVGGADGLRPRRF